MPDPAEEEAVQRMLLSMLTQRQPEPVAEQSELERGRAQKAASLMGDPFWEGRPMYYEPAAAYDFTDEAVHDRYMERLSNDAQHRAKARPEDLFYREAWEEGKIEDDRHPDWAFREGTAPWWPER